MTACARKRVPHPRRQASALASQSAGAASKRAAATPPAPWPSCSCLTGETPSELGNLADLTALYLSENHLSGKIYRRSWATSATWKIWTSTATG